MSLSFNFKAIELLRIEEGAVSTYSNLSSFPVVLHNF
uniref:Uncharacterized protein n=1 Tax=Rhizophora mucronata TaxID=61149 RepID=A0A2P2R4L5_RHIMU